MTQFMGNCKSRAQSTVFTNRTASVWVTNGSQFGKTYQKDKNKDLLSKVIVAWNKNMQSSIVGTEDTQGRLT